jgi:hypothetical protein
MFMAGVALQMGKSLELMFQKFVRGNIAQVQWLDS